MSVLMDSEYNLDLHILRKSKNWKLFIFFLRMEKEELSFTTENICSLWKLYEATQPQHHMPIEKSELNWLSFVKLEPWFTFLTNTTVAALFIKIFGQEM